MARTPPRTPPTPPSSASCSSAASAGRGPSPPSSPGTTRPAATVAIAGTATWGVAKLVKRVVKRGRPHGLLEGILIHGARQTGLGFPSGHAAVSACTAFVARGAFEPAGRAGPGRGGGDHRRGAGAGRRPPAARRGRRLGPRRADRRLGRRGSLELAGEHLAHARDAGVVAGRGRSPSCHRRAVEHLAGDRMGRPGEHVGVHALDAPQHPLQFLEAGVLDAGLRSSPMAGPARRARASWTRRVASSSTMASAVLTAEREAAAVDRVVLKAFDVDEADAG